MRPNVLIDLDGVLHKYSKGQFDGTIYDSVVPGAREFIDSIKHRFRIVIWTARVSKDNDRLFPAIVTEEDVKNFLNENNIYFDEINSDKLTAIAYVDDRAVEFKGNWEYVRERIEEYSNHVKKQLNIKSWKEI